MSTESDPDPNDTTAEVRGLLASARALLQELVEEDVDRFEPRPALHLEASSRAPSGKPAAGAESAAPLHPPLRRPPRPPPTVEPARIPAATGPATAPFEAGDRPSLEAVRAELGDCRRCALCEGRNTIVFGDGHPDADLPARGRLIVPAEHLGRPVVPVRAGHADAAERDPGQRRPTPEAALDQLDPGLPAPGERELVVHGRKELAGLAALAPAVAHQRPIGHEAPGHLDRPARETPAARRKEAAQLLIRRGPILPQHAEQLVLEVNNRRVGALGEALRQRQLHDAPACTVVFGHLARRRGGSAETGNRDASGPELH